MKLSVTVEVYQILNLDYINCFVINIGIALSKIIQAVLLKTLEYLLKVKVTDAKHCAYISKFYPY